MSMEEIHSKRPSPPIIHYDYIIDGHVIGDSGFPWWMKGLFGIAVLTMITAVIVVPIELYQRHNAPIVSREPAGKIVSVKRLPRIPGGFLGGKDTPSKTEVETDQLAIVFYGHALIKIGAESEILKDSRGALWFTWRGCTKRYRISGSH